MAISFRNPFARITWKGAKKKVQPLLESVGAAGKQVSQAIESKIPGGYAGAARRVKSSSLIDYTPLSMRGATVPSAKMAIPAITKMMGRTNPLYSPELNPLFRNTNQLGEDVGYGMRGALSLTPFQKEFGGLTGRQDKFAPTTQRQQTAQRVGRGIAGSAMIPGGLSRLPGIAGFGGLLGGGFQAGKNIFQGKPVGEDVLGGVKRGVSFGVQTAPTQIISGAIVGQIANKIPALSFLTDKGIQSTLPKAGQGLKQWLSSVGRTGVKRLVKAVLVETPVEALTYGITNKQEQETLLKSIEREAIENLIFNVGMAGAMTGGDALTPVIKKSIADAVQSYKKMTPEQRQGGFARLPGEPKVAEPLDEVVGEDILSQARKEVGKYEPSKKGIKQTLGQFYTDWVNKYQPIEDVPAKIEKETGTKIIPELSPKYTIKQLLGSGGTAGLRHKQKLQPILEAVDKIGISTEDFDVFLKAKRDLGFEEVGRVIRGSDPDTARRVVNALGEKHSLDQLETVANQFYQYQDEGLKALQDAGFIDQGGYNAIKAGNKNYVPFERIMDEVDDYLGMPTSKAQQAGQPIKRIKGSERQIISPTESIIANTYKIEAAVAKNRVAKSLVDLRKVAPQYDDLFKKVKPKMAPVATVDGETIIRPVSRQLKQSEIFVWENGKRNIYEVGDSIARSVKGLNEESMGTLVKILSAPARLLRQGATGRNIDFMIPNVFRDQLDAAVSSKYGYKPFLDYFRGLGNLINYKKTGSDELVEEYLRSGGSIFFENMSGRKAIREQIAEATTKPRLIKKIGKWAISGIEAIGEVSETPTRLGLFKRGLEKTSNPLLAAYESREGTLDFARMGAKMKTANAIIPFLNVGVQGFDKLIRNIKGRPGKMALNMAIYGGLPATLTAIYNNLFHPKELTAIPNWEKENNFIVVTGTDKDGKPKYIKMPKGNIIPYISNPIENFIAWAAGNDQQGFTQMALSLFSEAMPVLKGGETPKEILSRTTGGLLPQAVKPPVEELANYSFFKGREIVPHYLGAKPPKLQAFEYTPETYKKIGEITDISPLRVKNFLEGYLAGYVKVPTNIIEVIKDISEGEKPDVNQIPILRRFIGQSYSEPGDKLLGEARGKASELRKAREEILNEAIINGDNKKAKELADKHGIKLTDKEVKTRAKAEALRLIGEGKEKEAKVIYDRYNLNITKEEAQEGKNLYQEIYKTLPKSAREEFIKWYEEKKEFPGLPMGR